MVQPASKSSQLVVIVIIAAALYAPEPKRVARWMTTSRSQTLESFQTLFIHCMATLAHQLRPEPEFKVAAEICQ